MIRTSFSKTSRCFTTLRALQPHIHHPNSSVVQTLLNHTKEPYSQVLSVHLRANLTQLPALSKQQPLSLRSFAHMRGGKKNMSAARCSKSGSPSPDQTESSSSQNNHEESNSESTGARKKTQTKDVPKVTPPRDGNIPTGGDLPIVDITSLPADKGDGQTDENCLVTLKSASFSSNDSSRSFQQIDQGPGKGPLESAMAPPLKKYVSEGPVVSMPKRTSFEEDWKHLQALPIEDKRKLYTCRKYFTLKDIPSWPEYARNNSYILSKFAPSPKLFPNDSEYVFNAELNDKVSLFVGDITSLEIDCIVNAANSSLLGGAGVDGAIHRAAGPSLLKECRTLGGCPVGEAKRTRGYKLPCQYVIHTVGPMDSNAADLYSSYFNSLQLAFQKKMRTIAFPCISTGIYGFPNDQAVAIVLPIIRKILNRNPTQFDRIIFCLFMQQDVELYSKFMQVYFPLRAPGAVAS